MTDAQPLFEVSVAGVPWFGRGLMGPNRARCLPAEQERRT